MTKALPEHTGTRTTRRYVVDAVPGDGIGTEVVPAAVRCVDHLATTFGFTIEWRDRAWGCDHHREHGRMMPVDGLEKLASADAILLGAVGAPDIPDDITLWGLLIPIRREFVQYINLRPVRSLPGIGSPLRSNAPIDLIVVRENVEGEYSEVGGRVNRGRPGEFAVQEAVFTRAGVERVARFASDLARQRSGRLISATKSNGIIHTMPFWDEVVAEAVDGSGVKLEKVLIDALAARLVHRPESVDVIVASNLFGDILSDLAGALAGSIGVAPSANLDPTKTYPSMFEPVHGSAPDIAGMGIANPVGTLWAASMMLDHLGEAAAAASLVSAFEHVLRTGTATPDVGGTASTEQFTTAVVHALAEGTS
ncbi:tartrate dehydrogenase [Nonomuraea turcica]|uniref:tartrate dehydrogenase n=1 Tax=Nonomuraea sp. G32 TaxID=3067274 RepID=UPI00273BA9D3|nr:tartrate dehydrogenase [Nonomuraea sp. G32]MDP4511670.1 tartrate dehydrogenase [Nonomuraea sp. G32]